MKMLLIIQLKNLSFAFQNTEIKILVYNTIILHFHTFGKHVSYCDRRKYKPLNMTYSGKYLVFTRMKQIQNGGYDITRNSMPYIAHVLSLGRQIKEVMMD